MSMAPKAKGLKMFEDSNGNVLYPDGWIIPTHRRQLSAIPEDQYLDVGEHQVPGSDINLECDEVIEDWDNLSPYDVYSPAKNSFAQRQIGKVEHMEDSLSLYDGSPPPNSPVSCYADEQGDLSTYEEYMNNILQLWKEGEHATIFYYENLQEPINISQQSDVAAPIVKDVTESYQSSRVISKNGSENTTMAIANETNFTNRHQVPMESILPVPIRSRSPSPLSMESSEISFGNFRSVSPMILRSPSPLSSRSSSPRFIRSPSPLGRLLHELGQRPIEDYHDDNQVPNGEYYVMRTYSASPNSDYVPDVDNQFQDIVEESSEFPPYRWYVHQRGFNQSNDCVVPQLIEE